MNIQTIKVALRKISQDFDLCYEPDWFHILWISKRHARYLEYVGMCFDPVYTRFGKTVQERIRNIDRFASSEEYRKIKNEFSGQAITKREIMDGLKNCKRIESPSLRRELLDLHRLLLFHLREGQLALLTETKNKRQREILLHSILLHEWIHLLLIKNRISFKSVGKRYWKYDEGLVTYLEYYVRKRLSYLESVKKKVTYPSQKLYFVYAITFRKLLEGWWFQGRGKGRFLG